MKEQHLSEVKSLNDGITKFTEQNIESRAEVREIFNVIKELGVIPMEHRKMSHATTLKKELHHEEKQRDHAKAEMEKVQRDINAIKALLE